MLLNTSFNLKGGPIVNTPAEAFATFKKSGMDLLVLGDCSDSPGRPPAAEKRARPLPALVTAARRKLEPKPHGDCYYHKHSAS